MNLFGLLIAVCFLGLAEAASKAVLVAGTQGYWTYGAQADLYHAYGLLRNRGVAANDIVVMAVDDLVKHPENPFPDQIFNAPDGREVYKGVRIDYRGKDVTPQNFLAILKGERSKVSGGNGRVLQSSSSDDVLVYFVGPGNVGTIFFPKGVITANQLSETLVQMRSTRRYNRLLFLLDASNAGSMFHALLPSELNVYALAASAPLEDASFDYCDLPLIVTCLGTEFSHAWMYAVESNKRTLGQLYDEALRRTPNSTVSRYGNFKLESTPLATFFGKQSLRPESSQKQENLLSVPMQHLSKQLSPFAQSPEVTAESLKAENILSSLRLSLNVTSETNAKFANIPSQHFTQYQCHHDAIHLFEQKCINLGTNQHSHVVVKTLADLCSIGIPTSELLTALHSVC